MDNSDSVRLVEVGPRDGLQNEPTPVSLEAKVAFIEALADAGLKDIESGSFVSPRWVPQMADSAEVFKRIRRVPGVTYSALVPNLKGLEAAIASSVEEIAVFGSASKSFSRRNINCSIAESLERFRPVCEEALAHGMRVRGYVSCGLGCPYEGEISPKAVADVTTKLIELGCYEVALSDTIGVGTREKLARCSPPSPRKCRPSGWHSISTTRTARHWPTSWRAWIWVHGRSTVPQQAWEAALTQAEPRGMSRRRMSYSCWTEWEFGPEWTSRNSLPQDG